MTAAGREVAARAERLADALGGPVVVRLRRWLEGLTMTTVAPAELAAHELRRLPATGDATVVGIDGEGVPFRVRVETAEDARAVAAWLVRCAERW